jgi:hypothetical protein
LVARTKSSQDLRSEDGDDTFAATTLSQHGTYGASSVARPHGDPIAEARESHECVAGVIVWVHQTGARRRVITYVTKDAVAQAKSEHHPAVADRDEGSAVTVDAIRIQSDLTLIHEGEQVDADQPNIIHGSPLTDRD